jgi:hypothetical protein
MIGLDPGHQRGPLRDVGDLSAGEDQSHRIAQGVDGDVDLGPKAATRSAQRLVVVDPVFSAPAACWWALMTVESLSRLSRSASLPSASGTRARTPDWAQRWNRW